MEPIDFLTWSAVQHESTAVTRLKQDAALGIKPKMPPASVNSHNTGTPFQIDVAKKDAAKAEKKDKPKAKRKAKKKDD